MLVKHNLSTQNDLWKNFWWSGEANSFIFKNTRTSNKFTFTAKEPYKNTAISGNSFDIKEEQFGLVKLYNQGKSNLKITGLDIDNNSVIKPGESIVSNFRKSNKSFWIYLESASDAQKNNALNIEYLMISDQYVVIYLPHIDTLSETKKSLLPPEGDYKEIEPVRG